MPLAILPGWRYSLTGVCALIHGQRLKAWLVDRALGRENTRALVTKGSAEERGGNFARAPGCKNICILHEGPTKRFHDIVTS